MTSKPYFLVRKGKKPLYQKIYVHPKLKKIFNCEANIDDTSRVFI